jgi:predicted transcriptional regulator
VQRKDYVLSFTAGSLMHYETEQVIALYDQYRDWNHVKDLVVNDNIMQKGTISTRKREFAEIKRRLNDISDDEISFVSSATTDEIKLFCLILCCRVYKLLYEFIVEVVREKLLLFEYQIDNSDYENFIESKMLSSDKLQNISDLTRAKIKQVIFKILEQSTLIDSVKNKNIQKPYISTELEQIITDYNPIFLAVFLYSQNDILETKAE